VLHLLLVLQLGVWLTALNKIEVILFFQMVEGKTLVHNS
jgi:hypothetical protein